jgi:fido (protein-threonine AMPylation protein)
MSDEQKYTIQGLDEYIRQGEPQQRERSEAWKVAIGLQQVDRLQTSEYLLDTAKRHIEGDISIGEAKELIDSYYKSAAGRKEVEGDRTEEADKVAARITELIEEKTFSFTPAQLISIHRRLFEGIYKLAGRIRDYNITKNEWVLGGKTVFYASADTISDTLAYDMGQEREFNYANMNIDEAIRHLTRFCANLWQVHAFCEGNTRTTAVFMIKYLRTLGFNVVNDVFAENSWYFRNALVRANYSDLTAGISETTLYLERFFRSMLLGEEHDLRNRIMHVDWGKATDGDDSTEGQSANKPIQSAKLGDELPPKCKNCTLEEVAVLRIMHENPSATQKEIATAIGKSERTVKTITVVLQEKLIVKRVNGRRNGYWEFIE